MSGPYVLLPLALVERAIARLDANILDRPSKDTLLPAEPHECEDPSECYGHDGVWVTKFGPHPVAEALREAVRAAADKPGSQP